MDNTSALTELNIVLGDGTNTTFSAEEKARALKKAWRDSYVVVSVWDTSLRYSQGVYQYSVPDAVSAIQDIYIAPTGSSRPMPEPISNDLYEIVAGNIQFRPAADTVIPNGYVLYLKGRYKLDYDADTIDDTTMQEYVLAVAGAETLKLLAHKKANLFVKNDTTMGELIGLRRELLVDVRELRTRLAKEYESA